MDASQLVVRGSDLSDQLVRAFATYYLQSPAAVRAREQIALRSLDMHATDEEYDRLADIARRRSPEPGEGVTPMSDLSTHPEDAEADAEKAAEEERDDVVSDDTAI